MCNLFLSVLVNVLSIYFIFCFFFFVICFFHSLVLFCESDCSSLSQLNELNVEKVKFGFNAML